MYAAVKKHEPALLCRGKGRMHELLDRSRRMEQGVDDIVRTGYNKIVREYLEFAINKPAQRLKWIDEFIQRLSTGSSILELGCGAGLPITRYLVDRDFCVKANDISPIQIETARHNAPGADYIVSNMTSLDFADGSFAGVVAFFSLFHVPLAEQPRMLDKIWQWLKPGGLVVLSVGAEREPHQQAQWMGAPMYWSNAGSGGMLGMLTGAGFEVVDSEVKQEEAFMDESDPDDGVSFLWVLATKPLGAKSYE